MGDRFVWNLPSNQFRPEPQIFAVSPILFAMFRVIVTLFRITGWSDLVMMHSQPPCKRMQPGRVAA